jgi:uncharacterized hydrophobic protein (TIGR00271 family)
VLNITRPVTGEDISRMTDSVYIFDGEARSRKASQFWILLALSAVIASAGVITDSTATVIGAMIVAPLMTPILGTGFALVLADRRNSLKNFGLVAAGALLVVAIAYVMGLGDPIDVVAANNGQVAGRVSPGIIDLIAALATGVVGAFALVRSDISDTLPGVAIAISLVPPLAVVGLTMESGAYDQAGGALLLFLTNVAAIIATATVVLLIYPVRSAAQQSGQHVGVLRGRTLIAVGAVIVMIAIPLTYGTLASWFDNLVVRKAEPVASAWAQDSDWQVIDVTYSRGRGTLSIVAIGRLPVPAKSDLRTELDTAGLTDIPAVVTFVLGGETEVPVTDSAS